MPLTSSRQTKLKLRKGFEAAPLSYRVLMVNQFNDEDQKIISKGLIQALTPIKAQALLPKPGNHLQPRSKRSQWRMYQVSMNGNYDINVLTYKGLDIAVFYKRQVSVVTPEPEDPAPEGYIQDEDDLWARLDLFAKSPRQIVGAARAELISKDAELEHLAMQSASYAEVHEADVKTIASLRQQLLQAKTTTARKPSRK